MLFYSYFIFVAFLSNRFPRLPWPYASKQASLAIDAHVMEYGGVSRRRYWTAGGGYRGDWLRRHHSMCVMSRHILSGRQALGCVISVMRPSSTSFAAIQPVSCLSKIHPVRQWLPVFRPNGSLLPSVSPIMWLSVVPYGVGIQYQRRPHSVPMAPPFSTNDALIQYQWHPHSVPMAPPFSTNCALIQYQ